MTGKVILYRERGVDFSSVSIKLNKEKHLLKWGERKEICLPVGKHTIAAYGYGAVSGKQEFEINENESKTITLTTAIPPLMTILGIFVIILTFVLHYMELIPVLVFPIASTIVLAIFLFTTFRRKNYYQFKGL
jgi:hypothetical protein